MRAAGFAAELLRLLFLQSLPRLQGAFPNQRRGLHIHRAPPAQTGSMVFYNVPCLFEADKACWFCRHAGMIRDWDNWKKNKAKSPQRMRSDYFLAAVNLFASAGAFVAFAKAISAVTVPLTTSRSSSTSISPVPAGERRSTWSRLPLLCVSGKLPKSL